MTEGFQHAIAGGQGKLVISQLQSPNFKLVPLTGWAVLKNGAAYFANVTAQGSITADEVIVGAATGPQVQILIVGGVGAELFPTNATMEETAGNIVAETTGSGAGQFLSLVLAGPGANGTNDIVFIDMNSANEGGTSTANGALFYKDTGGTDHQMLVWDNQGVHVSGTLYGNAGTLTIADTVQLNSNMTLTGSLHIDGTLFGTGGVLTVGDAVQLNSNLTVTGTLSVGGSTDTGTPTNNNTSQNGLTDGTIHGTSGSQSAGTAHTHGPGSFAVGNGQHTHNLNSHQHPL